MAVLYDKSSELLLCKVLATTEFDCYCSVGYSHDQTRLQWVNTERYLINQVWENCLIYMYHQNKILTNTMYVPLDITLSASYKLSARYGFHN